MKNIMRENNEICVNNIFHRSFLDNFHNTLVISFCLGVLITFKLENGRMIIDFCFRAIIDPLF